MNPAAFGERGPNHLDRLLHRTEIYLAPKDDAQAAEIEPWLRGRPDVKAVLSSVRVDTRVADEPVELLGLADHATIRELWPR